MNIEHKFANRSLGPHLALIAVQLMFGTWPIVGKVALRAISTPGLVALRVGGASVALTLLQRQVFTLRKLPKSELAWLVLISMLGVVWNQLLYVKGLSLTTAVNATLLSTTIPVSTLLISVILGLETLSLRRMLGIALAAAGVVYLVDPVRADLSGRALIGNLLIVANSLSYGAYIALSKNLFKKYGALNVITWVFLIAAVFVVPIGVLNSRTASVGQITPVVWAAVIYTILVPTVAAYYLNAWA